MLKYTFFFKIQKAFTIRNNNTSDLHIDQMPYVKDLIVVHKRPAT